MSHQKHSPISQRPADCWITVLTSRLPEESLYTTNGDRSIIRGTPSSNVPLSTMRSHFRLSLRQIPTLDIDKYGEQSFRGFPIRYWDKLQRVRFEKKEPITVLDICCGAGNWALAVATYNRNASVIGIDKNEHFLRLAAEYRKRFCAPNVEFLRLNFRSVLKYFETESFDYIFTVNALQYLDERFYFETVSKLLKRTGRLLMFRTETIGWYLQNSMTGITERNFVQVVSFFPAVIAGMTGQRFPSGDCEHVVTYRRAQRIAMHYGILLEISQPPDRFLSFPTFIDFTGKRTLNNNQSYAHHNPESQLL